MNGEETVTLLRTAGGGFDAYGDPVAGTVVEYAVAGCMVAPVTSTEPSDRGREGVVIGWTVYAPAGTVALHADRIRIRGVSCAVEGVSGDWGSGGVVINAALGVG